jgi:hypothetical protein
VNTPALAAAAAAVAAAEHVTRFIAELCQPAVFVSQVTKGQAA